MELHSGDRILLASVSLQVISSVYLFLFDSSLRETAPSHWISMGILPAILVALIALYLLKRKPVYRRVLGYVCALGVFVMFMDAALDLPFTDFNPGISVQLALTGDGFLYLFGLGLPGTNSTFQVSLAFVALFASTIVTAIAALRRRTLRD